MHTVTCYGLIARRGQRALFLAAPTQQVKSAELLREIARGAAALGAVVAWGGLLLLMAG